MRRETRASYKAISEFMIKEDAKRRKAAKDCDGYVDFRDSMEQVQRREEGWCGFGTKTFRSGESCLRRLRRPRRRKDHFGESPQKTARVTHPCIWCSSQLS